MKTLATVLGLLCLAVSPAMAADATCSTADPTNFKPQADLESMLVKQGLTVVQIKTEGGCYEVYAKDAKGNRVNTAYNAETLEQVANAEAGE